jgi:2,3-bisphosphoglycerate-dependent phosphoglycerate mutase
MQTIYLVRHCQATGQASDAVLTEEGNKQAEALKHYFSDLGIKRIITSPFVRAIESIKPLAESIGMEIKKDSRLSERILSSENLPNWYELLKNSFENMDVTYKGGESSNEALQRGKAVLDEVVQQNDDQVILVSHGNLISLILHSIDDNFGFNEWESLTNPDVFKIEITMTDKKISRVWNH